MKTSENHDITPHAELLLNALTPLLRHSREKIFVKDKDLIYRAASQKFVTMAGWETEADIIGKTDFEIFNDQEIALRYREDDKKLVKQQSDLINYVEPLTEKDGRRRYASTSKFILRDDDGQFIGLVGVSRDITMDYYLQRNRIRELEYLFALPPDVYFAAYLDINDWYIISEHHQSVNSSEFAQHVSIDALVQSKQQNLVDLRCPARTFYQDFNHDTLTELYKTGNKEFVMEYQRYTASGEPRWVRDEVFLLEDAYNGHLCVMLVVRDIQQRKSDEAEHIRLAEHDELTGLLNRKATMQLIREQLAHSKPGDQHALFMIDADYFKDVNNTYGHQAGDQALTEFAQAITKCFRSTDIVGRIGGDEFFVLMTYTPDRAIVQIRAHQVLDSLRAVHYRDIHLSASIGVSFFPSEADTLEDLYALADKAMYTVKGNGRNGICFSADFPADET